MIFTLIEDIYDLRLQREEHLIRKLLSKLYKNWINVDF